MVMKREDCEVFLADVHVGIISIANGDRGPLLVPVWYDYEPGGELWLITARYSRKGKALTKVQRFSYCVQSEVFPYKYVCVEGPIISVEPADLEKHVRPMAQRYLGAQGGDDYVDAIVSSGGTESETLVRMQPEHWLSSDWADYE